MEPGDVNPNSETEWRETVSVADGFLDEGGVDTNRVAGPTGTTEPTETLLIELGINQSIKTTKFKTNDANAKTFEVGNNSHIDTIIQDKESGKNHYVCKFCSQVFSKHQALGGHMNGHSKGERNLEKYEKLTTWIHETYPTLPNIPLASEAELLGTPTNGAVHNSYNYPIEVGKENSQLHGQWTNQQSIQQIQLPQDLQIQQQLQYYQGQEPQHYQYSQRSQSNQVVENSQSTQVLESLQNHQTPQRLQNYQSLQGIQNHQASQESQRYQTPQLFQNYQIRQEREYYQGLQGSQNYQVLQGPQYHQASQRYKNYQTLQGFQSYQIPQGSQSYQASQGPQSYQTLQGSQNYQIPKGFQSYQTPQGQWQNPVVNANNQQNINLNSKTLSTPTSLINIPSNVKNNNLSNSQGLQRYMPNPHNLYNGDRLTRGLFINEHLNDEYYGHLRSNIPRRSNQTISIPHNYDTVDQYRPAKSPTTFHSLLANSPNTSNSLLANSLDASNSLNQSKNE